MNEEWLASEIEKFEKEKAMSYTDNYRSSLSKKYLRHA